MLTPQITPSRTPRHRLGLSVAALLSCTLALYASYAAAQTDSLLLRDYRFVQQADPWLTHQNAAALTRYQNADMAEAELSLSYGHGRLTPSSGSPNVLQAGAAIESYYRLSHRTVVFGAISYDNWTGRDMTGSAFMTTTIATAAPVAGGFPAGSTLRPFDIVEDSLTNPGRKHRDTYRLTGGVGVSIANGLAVGARLDYTAANYAKYKDLRHKNKLMDLTLTAGVYAAPLPWLSAGANYVYHRQTESVEFGTNGKSEKVYKSLIDYGAMMGLVEQFGNDGYTDKSREMPLFEDGHGGSLQLELRPLPCWSLWTSATLSHATGYYGRRSPYTITYTNHDRDQMALQTRLTYCPPSRTSRHCLDLSYREEQLKNRAETYRGLTNESGATHYEYYDPTETGSKQLRTLTIDYTMHLGIRGELPTWTVAAGYHWQRLTTIAFLYPYYRHQQLHTHEATAAVTRHIPMVRGMLSLTVQGSYSKGSGEPYEDGTLAAPSSRQEPPATMEAFLLRDYEYLTAAQYGMEFQAKYAFRFPGTHMKTHVRAAVQYRKATESYSDYSRPDYTTATIAVGATF